MKLFIVESPGKIRQIKSLLGPGFLVKASVGHVRDLPRKELGIATDDGFRETYRVVKPEVVAALRKQARRAEVVYLATDPDREGEAIAWHLARVLPRRARLKRITFSQLTEGAIRDALANPRAVDQALVDAQRARRVLDRLVGYTVSPLLRDLGVASERPLSAGRVQTAALRVVVEAERARRDFMPRAYWTVHTKFEQDDVGFRAAMVDPPELSDPAQRDHALEALHRAAGWRVEAVETVEEWKNPPPPFTTATLLRAASRALNLRPGHAQKVAEELYEKGLVTYVRTDATRVAPEAQAAARPVIERLFGPAALPAKPPLYRARGSAQEAHEAIRPIRPTRPDRLPGQLAGSHARDLSSDAVRLYDLVWTRFVASQITPAIYETVTVRVRPVSGGKPAEPLPYLFGAKASQLKSPGYLALYREADNEGDEVGGDEEAVETLSTLHAGDALTPRRMTARQRHTKPPSRLTQAGLIAELERLGIGRPSTYAVAVETILDRGYVTMQGRHLVPTRLGEEVLDLLVAHFPTVFDPAFTATLEALLYRVAAGELSRERVLRAFYEGQLAPALRRAEAAVRASDDTGRNPDSTKDIEEKTP